MPKERSRIVLSQTLYSIAIAETNDVPLLDDTTDFERPIGRKIEKANWKKKVSFGEYLAKKMNLFRNHKNKKKRVFASKQKGFTWKRWGIRREFDWRRKEF